jgi:hypothetical protein
MLNVTFKALMLFAYQHDAAHRAHCTVAGHPAKLAFAVAAGGTRSSMESKTRGLAQAVRQGDVGSLCIISSRGPQESVRWPTEFYISGAI